MHKKSDDADTESGSEDENNPAMKDGGNDDDEPPMGGVAIVEVENNRELETSLAPTAEPMHRVNPEKVIIV